jgi:hypothetical protein
MALDALSQEIADLDMCLPARIEPRPEAAPAPGDPAAEASATAAEDSDPERTRRNRVPTPRVLTTHVRSRGKTR